jgi:hypothetical protein
MSGVLGPGLAKDAQRVIPVRLQVRGHQPIVGIDGQVAPASLVGRVPRPFHVLAVSQVRFGGASFHLGLHREVNVEGDQRATGVTVVS